jgi:hypothetical protein
MDFSSGSNTYSRTLMDKSDLKAKRKIKKCDERKRYAIKK